MGFYDLEISKHAEQSLYGGSIGGIHTPVDEAYDGILVDDHIPPQAGQNPPVSLAIFDLK